MIPTTLRSFAATAGQLWAIRVHSEPSRRFEHCYEPMLRHVDLTEIRLA
jgi:hypothetical protein